MGNYREFRQQTRQKRRKRALRRLLAFLLAALAVLGLAWVITWAIERIGGGGSGAPAGPAASEGQTGLVGSVLAPLPMQVEQGGTAWQSVGPVRQTGGYTVVSPGAAALTLPERGLVDNSYFADAVFLGDSVTEGLDTYANPVKGVAAVYGYRSAGPSAILNRTSLHNFATETDEIALDKIAERAPKRLYILLGANALARDGEAEENAFLAYYGQMLDLIRETLGEGVTIYVQAMTPVRPEYTQKAAGLYKERILRVNDQLARLADEKNCPFVDLYSVLADENGDLREDYSADGLHMNAAGYSAWVNYLAAHTVYSASNPYLAGSPYYKS